MFIEPHLKGEKRGWIEVICGSMFSGKTEELIRRLKRARIANLKVEIFKPAMDTRYHEQNIVSHDETAIQSTPIDNSQTILLLANEVDVIGIDEAQFFDDQLPEVCDQLAFPRHFEPRSKSPISATAAAKRKSSELLSSVPSPSFTGTERSLLLLPLGCL